MGRTLAFALAAASLPFLDFSVAAIALFLKASFSLLRAGSILEATPLNKAHHVGCACGGQGRLCVVCWYMVFMPLWNEQQEHSK